MTFLSQDFSRRPGAKLTGRGSASASPSRLRASVSRGLLVADQEFGGIDVAVADPVLQRDAPLPAGLPRGGARVGRERRDARARDGLRAIARQPLIPMFVADPERVADQERAHAGAVDEEVAVDFSPSVSRTLVDEIRSRGCWMTSTIRPSTRLTHAPRFRCAGNARTATHRNGRHIPCRRAASCGLRLSGKAKRFLATRRNSSSNCRNASPVRRTLLRGQPELVRVQPQHVAADLAEAVNIGSRPARPSRRTGCRA